MCFFIDVTKSYLQAHNILREIVRLTGHIRPCFHEITLHRLELALEHIWSFMTASQAWLHGRVSFPVPTYV